MFAFLFLYSHFRSYYYLLFKGVYFGRARTDALQLVYAQRASEASEASGASEAFSSWRWSVLIGTALNQVTLSDHDESWWKYSGRPLAVAADQSTTPLYLSFFCHPIESNRHLWNIICICTGAQFDSCVRRRDAAMAMVTRYLTCQVLVKTGVVAV